MMTPKAMEQKIVSDYDFPAISANGGGVRLLIEGMGRSGGFSAPKFATAAHMLETMFKPGQGKVRWLSFPACLMATGTRGFFVELIKRKMVDVIVTTCGTIDHDIARSLGEYRSGNFEMDDIEVHENGFSRLGNVLVPIDTYGPAIESFLTPLIRNTIKELDEKERTIAPVDLIWKIGSTLDHDHSLCTWAYRQNIPIIVPGIVDGAVGAQLQLHSQNRTQWIDLMADQHRLSDIVWNASTSEAFMIGGGISKHHVIWWNQYRNGLDKAVYITTAVEYDGSLSGARLREAISWGKLKASAEEIVVEGEASLLLPLLGAYLF